MARPRTPAQVLELRGSFKKDPQRRRQDAEGAAPFEVDPPTHLAPSVVEAWRYIVVRLPKVALSSSDEVAVEMAAIALAGVWQLGGLAALSPAFLKLSAELRQWLGKLGMTPVDRAKVPAKTPEGTGNPFADA
jgi:hypothetical protein